MTEDINTAEYWDKTYRREGPATWRKYPKTFQLIKERVGADKTILELGSGPGILTRQLRQENYVFAVDISPIACGMTGEPSAVLKVPPIPAKDQCYDIIIATEFLEHIQDPEALIAECSRVAPRAIFVVPNNTLGPEECAEHHHKFTIVSLAELFEKHYKLIDISTYTEEFDSIQLDCILIDVRSSIRSAANRHKKVVTRGD